MFTFLNSAMLIAGAAAVIPLLIHLFSRRKMKVIEFSSLKYLQAMQKRQVRRIKIRQLLLLALRMLIIALAALAFARPVTDSGYLGSHAGVSAIILLDRSASMSQETNDGPVFNLARARARAILETFGEADEVALLTFGSGRVYQGNGFTSPIRASEELSEITPADGRGHLDLALEKTLELFSRAKHFNRELFVITDLQSNSLPDTLLQLASVGGAGNSDIKVYLTALGGGITDNNPRNCGIVSVDFGGQLIEAGIDFTTGITVKNYDDETKHDLIASLYIDGQRVAQTDLSLTEREEKRFTFTRKVDLPGRHYAYIQLSDDDLLADNQFNFTFQIPETFNLLILNNEAGGEYFRLALEPTESGVRHWLIKQINASRLGSLALDDYDVVALVGVDNLTRSESAALSRFVRRGGGLIVTPGPSITPASFSGGLEELTGLRLTQAVKVNPPGSGYFTLQSLEFTHPIFHPFAELYSDNLPALEFYTIPKFSTTQETRTLARFSGSHPALVERKLGRGKILTFSAILTPNYSNVVGHSFFVPFIIRLAEYAGSDLSRYDYHRLVGEETTLPLPRNINPNHALELFGPGGAIESVEASEAQGTYQVRLRPLARAGVYELRSRGQTIDRFAVNVDPAEGDLAPGKPDDLSALLGLEVETTPEPTALAGFLTEKRTGKEIWKLLLWLVVIALLFETLLAGDLFSKNSPGKNLPDKNLPAEN